MERFYLYKVLPDGSQFVLDSGQTLDQLRPKINDLGDNSDGVRYFVHDLVLGVTVACEKPARTPKILVKAKYPPGSAQA
jgi:hypothetical protein